MKSTSVSVLLILTGLKVGLALASPAGELDPAFGDHGRILLRDPPFEELAGQDVFVDAGSGKITVVANGYGRDNLLRFNSDGSLDPDFGVQGLAELDLGGDDLQILDVEWLADGRLLIAGAANVHGTPDNVVHGAGLLRRMHADGTPDLSFGNDGRVMLELGGDYEAISDILLQPDGKIVAFGNSDGAGGGEKVVARYTPNGLLDSSFGDSATPGIGVINVPGIGAHLAAVVQQSDGKFLICGIAAPGPAALDRYSLLAIRVQPDGAPDPTFGNDGVQLIGDWQQSVTVSACLELADGHVIFVGSVDEDERQRAAAWRMTPDGRLDTAFGTGGTVVLDTDTPSMATAMLIMADGSVAIAGTQWKPSTTWQPDNNAWLWWSDMLVARFDPTSGDIDPGFGHHGVTAVDFGAGRFVSGAYAASLKQQADGRLLVLGAQVDWYDWYPWNSVAIARIDPYGAGSNGVAGLVDTFVSAPAAGGEVALRLRRTGGSTGQLTVDYQTVADAATEGQDYVAASGTVTWPDGDMDEKTISITVLDPGQAADSKGFQLALSNSSGGLAVDIARIRIPSSTASGSSGSKPPVSSSPRSGGGALGMEAALLMALWVLGIARRAWRPGNRG
jgi:uncharacterized delta-60 repeat protein